MRDRGLILGGLALFLALATFPAWYDLAAGVSARGPELKLPKEEKQCVAPKETMRTSHMEMLVTWRDLVVRKNERVFLASTGRTYDMSLTKTCLKCHDDKEGFCDRCHAYAGLQPYCWDCHIDPKLVGRSKG
jgi:hypothetical protein